MSIAEIENRVIARLSGQVVQGDAESMRRDVPDTRNAFDSFVFQATSWALDEGAANSFSYACNRLQEFAKADPLAIRSVPKVPSTVAGQVGDIVSRWQPGPEMPGAIELPDAEARLRDELYFSLGGDLGDGVAAAGRRLVSRMWSGRIADGFVYAPVGACLWNGHAGINGNGEDVYRGGQLIAAIYEAGEMFGRWRRAEPSQRFAIDLEIVELANRLGWRP